MLLLYFRKLLMEAAMLLFLLTVSPVYAISEIESRKTNRGAVQIQMVTVRARSRALNRRINPYAPIGFYAISSSTQFNYGNWKDFVFVS
jgi:hypothetical protein